MTRPVGYGRGCIDHNAITYSAVVSALEKGKQPEKGLRSLCSVWGTLEATTELFRVLEDIGL